jgi:predicted RNA-binding protein with PIN domain
MYQVHRDVALAPPSVFPPERTATFLFMGKGDGKKKRKKKEGSSTDVPSSSASSQPPPLRVLSTVNIPVRQQIALANMNKMVRQQQQQSSSGGSAGAGFAPKPRVRTAYRRTWDEEEVELKAEERKRRGQEPNWDVILNRTAVDPLLIVDGYNIIYAWPRLKKHMLKGDPARARQLLMDDLENLQSIKGWRIECVFDGTRRASAGPLGGTNNGATSGVLNPLTRGVDQATKTSVSKYGVRVVYSGVGTEADTYIEGRCLRAKNVTQGEITGSLIVATDDAMIRLAGQNAGAVCMSASRFVEELKAIQKVISYRVEAAVAKVNGHAIRPEPLRGAPPTRFGRRSVVIEDKRNRTKVSKKEDETAHNAYAVDVSTIQLEEDENGIPWWAKVPEQSKFLKG